MQGVKIPALDGERVREDSGVGEEVSSDIVTVCRRRGVNRFG